MTEDTPDTLQQLSGKQTDEIKLYEENTEFFNTPTEKSQYLSVMPENVGKTSCKNEQLEARVVPEDAEGGDTPENYETSSLPASESFVADNSPFGDKSLKSPAETYSSFPSSVEINKTSVSSSPVASLELGSSHETMHSQASSLESSATLSTTYVALTPKIGMGKPAITKRKFSPGRPRSRQVSGFY